jgi:hypothetical protein
LRDRVLKLGRGGGGIMEPEKTKVAKKDRKNLLMSLRVKNSFMRLKKQPYFSYF